MNEMISVDEACRIFKDFGHDLSRGTVYHSISGRFNTILDIRGVMNGKKGWKVSRDKIVAAAKEWHGFPMITSVAHKLVLDSEIEIDFDVFKEWRRSGRYGLKKTTYKNYPAVTAASVYAAIENYKNFTETGKADYQWPNGEPKAEEPKIRKASGKPGDFWTVGGRRADIAQALAVNGQGRPNL